MSMYLKKDEVGIITCRGCEPTMTMLIARLAEERKRSEARRALLEKHQWVLADIDSLAEALLGDFRCLECNAGYITSEDISVHVYSREDIRRLDGKHHKPDCAIAAQLAGVKGE